MRFQMRLQQVGENAHDYDTFCTNVYCDSSITWETVLYPYARSEYSLHQFDYNNSSLLCGFVIASSSLDTCF